MNAADIVRHCARRAGVRVEVLRGPWQNQTLVKERRAAALRLRAELGLSYKAIGQALGRTHWTVLSYFETKEHRAERELRNKQRRAGLRPRRCRPVTRAELVACGAGL